MKFSQIPTDTFKEIQLNAGILVTDFTPASGEIGEGGVIGATSGGVQFTATPSYKDFGEDIDNCPKNMKELKRLDDVEVKLSGTFVTMNTTLAKMVIGSADADGSDPSKVNPRRDLSLTDFNTLWFVGDYSDKNGDTNGGYIAIKLENALSTGGFSIQTTDREKGQFAFEFTAHNSMNAQDKVPYEIYIKAGTEES